MKFVGFDFCVRNHNTHNYELTKIGSSLQGKMSMIDSWRMMHYRQSARGHVVILFAIKAFFD
jgi:hypothetical protein